MSRPRSRYGLVLALALMVPAGADAQAPAPSAERDRALLARVESLLAERAARDASRRAAGAERRRPRVLETRGLVLVVPQAVEPGDAQRALDSGRALVREFGAIPDTFVGRTAVIADFPLDTGDIFRRPDLARRHRARASVTGLAGSRVTVGGGEVASAVGRAYREALDEDWRHWLPSEYGVSGWRRDHAWAAFNELTRSPMSVAGRCVAGEISGCRLWLALDRDADPYVARFGGPDLRRIYGWENFRRSRLLRTCADGVDAACIEYARAEGVPSDIPAPEMARRGLLAAVRAISGAPVLASALGDTSGSIGARLARATGMPEDSLVTRWRYWVLTRGDQPRDRSTAADVAPALLLAGLLLALVVRSRG